MWTFNSRTGILAHNGAPVSSGYSGHGQGKNNPDEESIPNLGPLPHGLYIIGWPTDLTHMGPVAMPLYPSPQNDMYGRHAFWCHGDSIEHPGEGSDGCLCLPRATRETLAETQDRLLTVTAEQVATSRQ